MKLKVTKIRNDANYRGFKASMEQAKEILEFWEKIQRIYEFYREIST